MIVHVVLFKLKERTPENCQRVADALRSMVGRVGPVRSVDVGIDQLGSERSFDVALRTTHASWDELAAYADDPVHKELTAVVRELSERSVACDYEV